MSAAQKLAVFFGVAACLVIGAPATVQAQDAPSTGGPPPSSDAVRGVYPVDVIYTNIPGDPSAAVPGYPGVSFGPGTGTTHFDRVFGSPGTSWAITADTDLPTGADEVLIVNGVVEVVEGDPAAWAAGENTGFLDTKVGVNDAGDFVFATNTDGATTADEYIVFGDVSAGTFSAVAQEGGSADPPLTGATWGSTLETPLITDTGVVGFVSDTVGGLPTTEDEVLILGTTLLAQEGVTVPTGQVGGATEFWENFDLDDVWINSDGSSWIAQGDLTGDTNTDDVVVVDNAVVIQEGSVIAGSGFPNPVDASGIVGVSMDPAGNWFARGNNDISETDWVVRNGTVIAQTGAPAFTGATENWSDVEFSDCFFLHVGDAGGNWIIGGVTDAPTATNGLLVLNGTTEVLRESDPIDLDGNGTYDDDAFVDTYGNDDAYIDGNGILYIVATIKDGTGARIGQGLLTVDLSTLIPVELQSFTIE